MKDRNLLRVATFNANSVRSRLHIILPWLEKCKADVLCIQETKVQDMDFPQEVFSEAGYNVVFRGQKAYNGVAVASIHELEDVAFGFGDSEDSPEDESRLIRCRVHGMPIVNTYVPQGRAMDNPYFQIKLNWFRRLRAMFSRDYTPDAPLIWCGDMNVAPEPIDVHSPERLKNHVCFHADVRKAFGDVKAWGFVDIFRKFHPEPDQYTFFDYRVPNSVKRRLGWRIDHILATSPLAERAVRSFIDMEPRMKPKPSDHTFLVAEFDVG